MRKLKDRFYTHVSPEPNTGCWLWMASGMRYGKLKVQGKTISAHRLSYILHKGPVMPNLFVLHTCDVAGCVNPDHLYVGNNSDNQKDRYQRSKRFNRDMTTGRFCGS